MKLAWSSQLAPAWARTIFAWYVPGVNFVVGNWPTYRMTPSGSAAGSGTAARPMGWPSRWNSSVIFGVSAAPLAG